MIKIVIFCILICGLPVLYKYEVDPEEHISLRFIVVPTEYLPAE